MLLRSEWEPRDSRWLTLIVLSQLSCSTFSSRCELEYVCNFTTSLDNFPFWVISQ
jgi:hypothetical protein